jgi:hypothetical protein
VSRATNTTSPVLPAVHLAPDRLFDELFIGDAHPGDLLVAVAEIPEQWWWNVLPDELPRFPGVLGEANQRAETLARIRYSWRRSSDRAVRRHSIWWTLSARWRWFLSTHDRVRAGVDSNHP